MTLPEPTPDTATLHVRLIRLLHANGWKHAVEQQEARDWQGAPDGAWNLHTWTRDDKAIQTAVGDVPDYVNWWTNDWDEVLGSDRRMIARLGYDWAVRLLVAVGAVPDPNADALAVAEQQTAELTQELARAFVIHCDKLLETTANGDAPDFSQIQLGDLDTATPDELRAEIRRLDHRLRWAYRHNDDNQTASLLGLFEIRKQREEDRAQVDAARAEVAELTQQRDQAVAALANARKTIAHELVAEGERIREAGHFAAAKAFGGAALFVMGDEALAVPVPAGDTSHDEPEVQP